MVGRPIQLNRSRTADFACSPRSTSVCVSRTGAVLFFQLMTRRYEHASTVLTSIKGFEEWGDILGDDVMAAALIDRLVH